MVIFKSEDLTGKILEKSPSRVKAKGKRLKIGTQSDDERGSSKPSSERDSELEELVKQRKKKQKKRLISLELGLTRGKNVKKSQVVSQNMNMMTG